MTQREKDLELEEKRWLREKQLLEREQQLKEDKKSFRKKFHKKIPTSIWLIYFLFINCTLIELFTVWVTIKSLQLAAMTYILPDFTPLVTLIGAVVSEVIGFGVYSSEEFNTFSFSIIHFPPFFLHINNMQQNAYQLPLQNQDTFLHIYLCIYYIFP